MSTHFIDCLSMFNLSDFIDTLCTIEYEWLKNYSIGRYLVDSSLEGTYVSFQTSVISCSILYICYIVNNYYCFTDVLSTSFRVSCFTITTLYTEYSDNITLESTYNI